VKTAERQPLKNTGKNESVHYLYTGSCATWANLDVQITGLEAGGLGFQNELFFIFIEIHGPETIPAKGSLQSLRQVITERT